MFQIHYRFNLVNFSCFCIILFLSTASCKKAGFGGDGKIQGYVHVHKWNATFTQFIGQYPGKDVYVYIVYGKHLGYDKRIKTDYNGMFEFPSLYQGDYTVYVYSRDSTFADASGTNAVVQPVTLTKRGQTFVIDTLLILQ